MYSFSLSGFLHEGGTPVLTVSSLGAAFILSTSAIEWPTEPPLAAPARVPRMIAVVRHHHAQLWPQDSAQHTANHHVSLFLLALVIGTAGNQHGAHSCNGLRFNTPHASIPFVPSLALSAIDIAIIGNLAPPRRRTLRNVPWRKFSGLHVVWIVLSWSDAYPAGQTSAFTSCGWFGFANSQQEDICFL